MERQSGSERPRRAADDLRVRFGRWIVRATSSLPPVRQLLEAGEQERQRLHTENLALHKENEQLSLLLSEANAKSERLMRDDVVNNFLNRQGLKEFVTSNEELGSELREGSCGLLFLDVRFLKFINDQFGYLEGDVFLEKAGKRIDTVLADLVRTASRAVNEDLRRVGSPDTDIRVRYGGDEFVLIIRNVLPEQLAAVEQRVATEFSVEKALDEAERQEVGVPVVASVSAAHASSIDEGMRTEESPRNILTQLLATTKARQEDVKRAQYNVMFEAVQERAENPYPRPADDRGIANLFIMQRYPMYYAYMHRKQYGRSPSESVAWPQN